MSSPDVCNLHAAGVWPPTGPWDVTGLVRRHVPFYAAAPRCTIRSLMIFASVQSTGKEIICSGMSTDFRSRPGRMRAARGGDV